MSMFKHAEGEGHHTLHDMVEAVKHTAHEVLAPGPHIARCTCCHAELAPEDVALGCCSDREACGCRAYSARCW